MPLVSPRTSRSHRSHTLGMIGSGGAASVATERTTYDLPVVLRDNLAARPTEMNPLKGMFGEGLAERLLDQSSRGSTTWIEPLRRSGQGIDLLRIQNDSVGRPRSVSVYEVKFGTSQLGSTRDGRQLGEAWTLRRLGENARALLDQAGSADTRASRTLRAQARCLLRAAEGRCPVERNVVRVKPNVSGFQITVDGQNTDDSKQLANGRFAKLPTWMQQTVRKTFEDTFRESGCSPAESRRLAREACRNPEFFRGMARHRRWTGRAGFDGNTAIAAVGASIFAAGMRMVLDLWTSGRIGWRGVACSGLLGGAAAGFGAYTGVQTVTFLTATNLGRELYSRVLATSAGRALGVAGIGRVAGGLVGAMVFAYGGVLLGVTDWRTANRSTSAAFAGAGAGFGATGATFSIAVAFGTAGTGTAISTLSGASAHGAALAWLGGGTVASGGGGMLVGGAILTGVGAVVMVIGSLGVGQLYRWLDERERMAMVEGRIELARMVLPARQGC